MPRGKKTEPATLPNDSDVVTISVCELKRMMKTIATEVFETNKGPLKEEIEEECDFKVYIQSVEIEETFEKFQEELKQKGETTAFRKIIKEQCCETMRREIQSRDALIENLQKENQRMKRSLEKQQFQLSCKDIKIEELAVKVDQIEQNQYSKNVRIVGLVEEEGDQNDVKRIQKIAKTTLGVMVKKEDLAETYRLGKVTEKKKARDLILKFKKKSIRDEFYKNRKKLMQSEEQPSIFINEQLTERRANMFFAARKLVKAKKLHSVWSQRGNILVRKEETDKPKQIRSHNELAEITGAFTEDDEITDYQAMSDQQESSDEDD